MEAIISLISHDRRGGEALGSVYKGTNSIHVGSALLNYQRPHGPIISGTEISVSVLRHKHSVYSSYFDHHIYL